MSDAKQAFEDIVFVGRRLKGVVALAERFNDFATFEAAESEAQGRIDSLKSQATDLDAVTKRRIDAAVAKTVEDAKTRANQAREALLDAARGEATGIRAKAKTEAEKVRANADFEAKKSVDAARKEVLDLEVQMRELGQHVQEREATLKSLEEKIKDAETLRSKLTTLGVA